MPVTDYIIQLWYYMKNFVRWTFYYYKVQKTLLGDWLVTSQGCDAYTKRFLNFVIIKSSSDKKFHKISKLYNLISDRHAKVQVSAPVRAGARRFLRFSILGSAGWPAKNWCQNLPLVISHPMQVIFFMYFLVLGQPYPQNLVETDVAFKDSLEIFWTRLKGFLL